MGVTGRRNLFKSIEKITQYSETLNRYVPRQ
jgi:hypothetical protein